MADTRHYQSWGRYPPAQQQIRPFVSREQCYTAENTPLLAYGNGRSYGDVCLNDGGVLLAMRGLDRFIEFDAKQGVLRCEAGVLLADILRLVVPRGWFLATTPGTCFVTVGGAIANDVHGKNHHRVGTFGHHVRCFELLRSDGKRYLCSPQSNPELFAATIGGLGLTGVIVWAEIALQSVANPYIDVETLKFAHLDDFFHLAEVSEQDYEHTVAWVDCAAVGSRLGRGLFMRANYAAPLCEQPASRSERQIGVPLTPPFSLINQLSLKAFNGLYYHRQWRQQQREIVHYRPFFYPLDSIRDWNRIYGPRGFLQYQCVVPWSQSRAAIAEMLQRIAASGQGSFLAVLKVFGCQPSLGLLSFARHGTTLALDFPNLGSKTMTLLEQLDEVVVAAGGAVYPAKDARMSGASFRQYFPRWQEFSQYIDTALSSSFWRRVNK